MLRWKKELKRLEEKVTKTPCEVLWGLVTRLEVDGDVLKVELCGLPNSQYKQNFISLKIHISKNYPFEAPSLTFAHFIDHPRIDPDTGIYCVDDHVSFGVEKFLASAIDDVHQHSPTPLTTLSTLPFPFPAISVPPLIN